MKKIPLRTMPPEKGSAEPDLEWAEIVRQVVRKPLDPQKGADIEEMRKGIRILDAVDASNGTLDIEDADWEHLKTKVLAMPWAVVDRRIVRFVDDVVMATDQPTL